MKSVIGCFVGLAAALAAPAGEAKPDPWQPVRLFIGHWTGTTEGQPGAGTVDRSYEFILSDHFIEEHSTSTYPPQEKNKTGEVHNHMSVISYDRERNTLMIRQFHVEGFVNLYALNRAVSTPKQFVFESERFENFNNSWKAKETYDIISQDEFIETFELAPPGKPFQVYSRNHLKRAKT
ncbi:MAG TPA: hypothetical protein VKB46_19930 [Pyrinomonadaceae bacterium]|nr:hypothetical protein [Pyrinomonadaceae bacterium]